MVARKATLTTDAAAVRAVSGARAERGEPVRRWSEVALLVAMTIPGLAVGLIALAAADRLALWFGSRSWLPWHRNPQHRRGVSSTAFDEMAATLYAGTRVELDQRRTERLLRDDVADGAPPRSEVDLDRRVAVIRLPPP